MIKQPGFDSRGLQGMVSSIDQLASSAGVDILKRGGSAADAAVAANAVLAVTSQHMCGLGGDLFAIVHPGGREAPRVLNASGRSGSGADPEMLRSEGHTAIPFRGDVRAVTVPGCVDGWLELHRVYGRLPFAELLSQATHYAETGFPVAPTLAQASRNVLAVKGADDFHGVRGHGLSAGQVLRRPRIGKNLRTLATSGRDGWYGGQFGEELVGLGSGLFVEGDLIAKHADWQKPLGLDVWGHRLWTAPPNSQGYLTLLSAGVASGFDFEADRDDAAWLHILIEASKLAGVGRTAELHEDANGEDLIGIDRIRSIRQQVETRAIELGGRSQPGDTTYLCAVDSEGMSVSLIQSNAAGFGAHLVLPESGVFLHNRGLGFSLEAGHPAEYGPRRRPPHTLSPAMITRADGQLHSVLGTMGGDRQPQVVLQLVSALLLAHMSPAEALALGRWGLSTGDSRPGFGGWDEPSAITVDLEGQCPQSWAEGLASRGHVIYGKQEFDSEFGHAQIITSDSNGLIGAADPRTQAGAAVAW